MLVSIFPAAFKMEDEFFVEALGSDWWSLDDRGIGIGIGIGSDVGVVINNELVDNRDGSVVDKMVEDVSTEVRSIGDPRSLGLLKTSG